MKSKVCLTGMHRSGTSLTASWLQACGLKIDNGQLIGGSTGNLNGHFEDKDFVDLHSQIILQGNKKSKGWIEFSRNHHFQESDKEKIKFLFEERKEFQIWGWKDPRSVLFLEEWVNFAPDIKFIFLWRPAFEVVSSLVQRKKNSNNPDFKISRLRSFQTWKYYNKQVVNFYKNHPEKSLLIKINKLIVTDRDFYHEISKQFNLDLQFVPIEKLVDGNLLKSRSFNTMDKIFYRILGLSGIEKELEKLSF